MEAVLDILRDTRVGCISIRRKPPEEKCTGDGSDGEGEGSGPGPPEQVFSLVFFWGRENRRFFSFVISFVHSSFSFVWRPIGARGQGSPTTTGWIGLGQDMVMYEKPVAVV